MDVTTIVFSVVIFAALLHAVWNALVKSTDDKHLSMVAVILGHLPIALVFLPFVPAPDPQSWPYIAGGIVLHVGYQIFLFMSYRIGDLTQVYPIARGSAPLLVAGISVVFLGVHLSMIELLAIVTIGCGIISLTLVRQRDGMRNGKAGLLAFITGCFIAGYSLVDGLGAREAGTSIGFYVWLTIGNVILFAVFSAYMRPELIMAVPRHAKRVVVIGGGASFLAYALVMWAFMQAPIALVTALRETSIVFALLIGVFALKERLDLIKVLSTMVTLIGVVLLRFSKS